MMRKRCASKQRKGLVRSGSPSDIHPVVSEMKMEGKGPVMPLVTPALQSIFAHVVTR